MNFARLFIELWLTAAVPLHTLETSICVSVRPLYALIIGWLTSALSKHLLTCAKSTNMWIMSDVLGKSSTASARKNVITTAIAGVKAMTTTNGDKVSVIVTKWNLEYRHKQQIPLTAL